MPGVIIQAQMVSQILSAVLDKRPLLHLWSNWGELFWIWSWSMVASVLAWQLQRLLYLGLLVVTVLGALSWICFYLLLTGIWVPLIPAAIALVTTSGIVWFVHRNISLSTRH